MADYTLFTNPMSRGTTARWALHEAGADYEQVIVAYAEARPAALLAANAMGKLPTLIHHAAGDAVITETAAICAYLADVHGDAGLAPRADERANYYRWLFFAAGPIESAITSKAFGFEPNDQQQGMAGWGTLERTVNAIDQHLAANAYVAGERFTMADVYVGASLRWGTAFGTLPVREAIAAYVARLDARPAYQAAKAIDDALLAAKAPA